MSFVFTQELEEIGEKKMKEYKELLEEHQHILDEVKHLEEDLHNKPNEWACHQHGRMIRGIKTKDSNTNT